MGVWDLAGRRERGGVAGIGFVPDPVDAGVGIVPVAQAAARSLRMVPRIVGVREPGGAQRARRQCVVEGARSSGNAVPRQLRRTARTAGGWLCSVGFSR